MAEEIINNPVTEQAEQKPANQEPNETKPPEEKTFTQADVDRIIAQRVSSMERKIREREQAAREEGRTEAEKLAKMSEEQRIQHEREQAAKAAQERENDLKKREEELTRRELRTQAVDSLESKGLPRGLADILNYTDAETCNASIESVEKVFRESVQAEVDKRLRASGVTLPSSAGKQDYSRMTDEEYYSTLLKK